jgi:hypothetical protein
LIVVGVNVHPAKPPQPLRNIQLSIHTRITKRVIFKHVDVHAAQTPQPLRKLELSMLARASKGFVVVRVNVDPA